MLSSLRFWQKIMIISSLSLLVSACGFHLRKQEPLPPSLKTMYIDSSNPFGELTIELKQILKSLGVTIVDEADQAPVTLKIFAISYNSDVLSESASSSTKQYVLHFSAQYELTNEDGKVLYGPNTVKGQRNYTVNEDQVLSTDTQQETLQDEMQHDAVFTIVRQISSPEAEKAVAGVRP